ncbi:MAG: orotidine 5'-phosphate decarboxylase [Nitrososphaera sp.]|jgi:orotidine-5'-phosphate decarboxylase
MASSKGFRERIKSAAVESPIIVALDIVSGTQAPDSSEKWLEGIQRSATDIIDKVHASVCAIKLNFHLLLPLSATKLASVNRLAHSYGLLSIADIKLNDIEHTNEVALDSLVSMGFDGVIANPFMGSQTLKALTGKAHAKGAGVVALAYMSHPGAAEGYGLDVHQNGKQMPLYRIFIQRAKAAGADGIVVGAMQKQILAELAASGDSLPIYSPGIGAQGASVEDAVMNGCDYLIVGRSIIEADDPAAAAREMKARAIKASKR